MALGEQSTNAIAQAIDRGAECFQRPVCQRFSSLSEMQGSVGLSLIGEMSGKILVVNATPFSR